MDLARAFQIVVELARQNIISNPDPEFDEARQQQTEAVDMVEDFAVNQLGDD